MKLRIALFTLVVAATLFAATRPKTFTNPSQIGVTTPLADGTDPMPGKKK